MKAKDDCATDHLVGIDGQVEAIMDLLDYDFGRARCLGIHGPNGIGKTTLAKALCDKLVSNFDRYCFLQDVSASSRHDGLVYLQKKVLSNILSETEPMVDINDVDDGIKVIRGKVIDKKVLIVLDDVDHSEQLKKLIGKISWFGTGSRVIITTRSKSILECVEKIIPYEMKEMNFDQALTLYMNHAFRRESPKDDHYDRLSRDIVPTFGGLPLVIGVIGSFLCGKQKSVWNDILEKLRSIAHEEVHRKLKISYDALNFKQKQIFLDIACLSFHEEEINASYLWKDHDLIPQADIEVLNSLSLINIKKKGGLWMHDLLKDLGRQIVHNEKLDLGKHSRLWVSEEAVDMVKIRENKENIEALILAGDPTLLIFTHEDFARLPNLRFLKLDGASFIGNFTNLFSKLRWFSWSHCPPDLIATNLFPQNLVVLQLSEFNGANDWEGWSQIKVLQNLKVLELTRLNMVKIDLSRCFSLERLIIKECRRLVQIDRSIGELKRLAYLNIKGCYELRYLPGEIGLLVNLMHLSLSQCSMLRELPSSIGKLNSLIKLDLSFTSIKGLPHSVGCLVNLKSLSLVGCRIIRELPDSIGNLESLIELDLSFTFIKVLPHSIGILKTLNVIKMEHCRLEEFPSAIWLASKLEVIHARRCFAMMGEVSSEIGNLSFLRILDLSYTRICRVPETVGVLPHLEELILRNCNELQMLPSLPTSLTHLLVSSRSLQSIPDLSNLTNLVNLLLSDGSEYHLAHLSSLLIQSYNLDWIGKLLKLENLHLCLRKITVLSAALGSLSRLRKLYISGHLHPKFLMQHHRSAMPENLSSITTIPDLSNLRNLVTLNLSRSLEKEIQLSGLEQLRLLSVRDFPLLEKIIFSPSGLKNLKELELHDCLILREIDGSWASETLENLKVELCPSISRLSDLSRMPKLMELKIRRCNKLRVFESIDKLGCLSLFEVICCPSLELEYGTNASDTMIPDECQVVIQYCSILHDTPEGGMFYKDYREKILRQIKSDSDTSIRARYFHKDHRDEIPGRIESDSESRTSNCKGEEAKKQKPPSPQQDDGGEDIDRSEIVDMLLKVDGHDQEVEQEGTEKVEALCLNFQRHTSDKLSPEDFKSMPNMRFLQLDHADIAGDFANLFPNLRWLRWHGCPRSLQVTNFQLENLTILDLSWSKVTKGWEGWCQIKMQNLRVLDLTGCADLLVTPKLSGCQNLAILILERCSQLVKIDHSIGDLKCLVSLNLKFCTELSMLPIEVGHLTTLKELLMDGTSVQEIPISIGHLKQLETLTASNCFSLSQLPRTICHLINISFLSLNGTKIAALPNSIGELVRLKHLSLRDCRRIRKLPNSIGNIGRSLVELDVSGTGISKFPDSIKNLQNLKVLRMDSCFFTEFPPDIGELTSLEEIHASWCRSLEGSIPSGIRKLQNLRILRLQHSSISSIPAEIHQLSNLRTLDLLHSNMLEELPTLPPSKQIRL